MFYVVRVKITGIRSIFWTHALDELKLEVQIFLRQFSRKFTNEHSSIKLTELAIPRIYKKSWKFLKFALYASEN